MSGDRKRRPMPGAVITREIRIPVCAECGHAIDSGLCSDTCPFDGDGHEGHVFAAVYSCIETFLRDEEWAE